MESRKWILKQTLIMALLLLACTAAMFGVFALLHSFSVKVLVGGIVGWALSAFYYFFMTVGNTRLAEAVTTQGAKPAVLQAGIFLRYIIIFALLVVGAKSGYCNPIAMVVPLGLMRPVLMIYEFFRK